MLRIKESIDYAKSQGKKILKKELAAKIWSDAPACSAYVNLLNLSKGHTRKLDANIVETLCKELGVTADYLFGISPYPNQDEVKKSIQGAYEEMGKAISNL